LGTTPGGGTVASMTNSLPTTGADLLAMGAAAVEALGVGAGTIVLARRRRAGDAA
jgi:LPXTG-motif cell wall-anchored protein